MRTVPYLQSCSHKYRTVTHLSQVDFSTTNLSTGLFPIAGYYYHYFIEIPVLNANSVDPDQIPHSAASDLGLHCLPIPFGSVS